MGASAEGAPETMTLLHGFPSSSHDWARVAPALAERYALLMPDFLGFGASEKPAEHTYSLHEQADLVEALWRDAQIGTTGILAHDYAVSVTQELLARRSEGALDVELSSVRLNGGSIRTSTARSRPRPPCSIPSRAPGSAP